MFLELVTEVACCNLELFMLLRKCVGLCFEAAFDFELRRKELMRHLGYGICVLRKGRFPKSMFYVLELLPMDTDVIQCVFGGCSSLMYY